MNAPKIPLAQNARGGGIQAGDVMQPSDAGIECQVARARMMPSDVGCQTTHRDRACETTVNEQRTALFE